jgi:hypothetical protein
MRHLRALALLFVVAIGVALHAASEGTPEQQAASMHARSGRDAYQASCAACHGSDGKGSPDLTNLARRNDGVFPADRVEAFLTTHADHAVNAGDKTRVGGLVEHLATMQTEVTMVAGTLVHHLMTADRFHIGDVWLSQGVDQHVAIILTADPERFVDVKGVRILTGTLIHDTKPNTWPAVHELFLKDLMTGAFSAVTFETTNPSIAKTFDFFDNPEVSVIIQITRP